METRGSAVRKPAREGRHAEDDGDGNGDFKGIIYLTLFLLKIIRKCFHF
jgi:hypothetical protein